jgi:protein TonB
MDGRRPARGATNGTAPARLPVLSGLSGAGAAPFYDGYDDPMSRVLGMDDRVTGLGAWFGFTSGGTLLMVGLMALVSVVAWLHRVEAQAAEAPAEVDVMREEAPPPPPTAQPDEHKSEPAPPPRAMPHEAPPPPPPAPAQAGKVLTAEPDPNEPVDLTGNTIVTGNADSYAGGSTSAGGTSTTAVRGTPSPTGVPGGLGRPSPAPAPPGPDRSHPAVLGGGKEWNCPFPAEADAAQVDEARVQLEVEIRGDGVAGAANVLKDPGYGFGRAARQCALRQRHTPALDHDGNPIPSTIRVNVHFSR